MEKRKNRAMEKLRKSFQGVGNIVRFNWHFYVGVILICIILYFIKNKFSASLNFYFTATVILALLITTTSLIVSFYIYDLSDLYKLNWLPSSNKCLEVVNIHAGFDETSILIKEKYKTSNVTVLDFYDPIKHTEVSIKRARRAYPAYPNTIATKTVNLPLQANSIDKIFVIFAAHEIRNQEERVLFFKELYRTLKNDGEIYVTEHIRDVPNFVAYNIGFLHFLTKASWYNVFLQSTLIVNKEQKPNLFITTFTLTKHGNTT